MQEKQSKSQREEKKQYTQAVIQKINRLLITLHQEIVKMKINMKRERQECL